MSGFLASDCILIQIFLMFLSQISTLEKVVGIPTSMNPFKDKRPCSMLQIVAGQSAKPILSPTFHQSYTHMHTHQLTKHQTSIVFKTYHFQIKQTCYYRLIPSVLTLEADLQLSNELIVFESQKSHQVYLSTRKDPLLQCQRTTGFP